MSLYGEYIFPVYNALFHTIKGLIFMRDGLAYKVTSIIPDENSRNRPIKNKARLKKILFNEILKKYNARIDKYDLKFNRLKKEDIDKLELVGFKLVQNISDEEIEYSGRYSVFPKTFVCKKCGDFRILSKDEWSRFNPKKCRHPECDGEYEQVSLLMFCETCGKITPLYFSCKEHGKNALKLIRKEKDSLLTWKVVCWDCFKAGKKKPIDIFRFTCNHIDENGNKISSKPPTKFKPLTIKEGGVYTPVVITSVDVTDTKSVDLEDAEFVMLGLYLRQFDNASKIIGEKLDFKKIISYLNAYKDEDLRKNLKDSLIGAILQIKSTIQNLKSKYSNLDKENFNNYFAITTQESKRYEHYLNELRDDDRHKILSQVYNALKSQYGISDVMYVPKISLVSAGIGIINGPNKFYEPNFVPHFTPIWKSRKRNKMIAYTYPFETEGIIIELDKIRVCNWLIDNELIKSEKPQTEKDAIKMLIEITPGTPTYSALKTLLHTFSHVLIRRASLYTGLDSDSCSELIFVNHAAFLIYSTSNINTGGFLFVFEHSLRSWFRDVELEIRDCTFDPACITERGACFSCLYLPEYVCTEFNQYLDRDVFLGSVRYHAGYW